MKAGELERLAEAVCDAWWALCGDDLTWVRTPEEKRRTFREMAGAGVVAGKKARGILGPALEARVAQAMNEAFLTGPGAPWWLRQRYAWRLCLPGEREVFLIVARALMAAGRAINAERRAADRGPIGRAVNENSAFGREAAHG